VEKGRLDIVANERRACFFSYAFGFGGQVRKKFVVAPSRPQDLSEFFLKLVRISLYNREPKKELRNKLRNSFFIGLLSDIVK